MPACLRPIALVACMSASVSPAAAADVVVFAAASLKTALDQIARDWAAETGDRVLLSYAGSGQQARQIIEGAPADIFLSASKDWMDEVEREGLIVQGTRRDLLGNTLVLIGHGAGAAPVALGPEFDLAGQIGDGKLAMGLVGSVPAGQYGKAALESLGLWASVSPLVAQSDNVRTTLALVASGDAPYGIVYATDAAAEGRVSVIATFPAESHPSIVYPAALLSAASDDADRAFFDSLAGEAAQAVFAAAGFLAPGS